jgi:hypothetical protein
VEYVPDSSWTVSTHQYVIAEGVVKQFLSVSVEETCVFLCWSFWIDIKVWIMVVLPSIADYMTHHRVYKSFEFNRVCVLYSRLCTVHF